MSDMTDEDDRLGRIAYEAYCTQTGGKSLVSGVDLPKWEDNESRFRTAWITVARTVLMSHQAHERIVGHAEP